MKMQITFNGGAQVEVDVTRFETSQNYRGELTRVAWTTPAGAGTKLHWLGNLDTVACIVAVHEPGDTAEAAGEDAATERDGWQPKLGVQDG
jgi:hypothetical protein